MELGVGSIPPKLQISKIQDEVNQEKGGNGF